VRADPLQDALGDGGLAGTGAAGNPDHKGGAWGHGGIIHGMGAKTVDECIH